MAVKVEELKRVFKFGKENLSDLNPNFTVEEIRKMYSNTYPELVIASTIGPKYENGMAVYEFKASLGNKG